MTARVAVRKYAWLYFSHQIDFRWFKALRCTVIEFVCCITCLDKFYSNKVYLCVGDISRGGIPFQTFGNVKKKKITETAGGRV